MDPIESLKKEALRRNYSSKTIESYVYCVKKFLTSCQKDLNKIKNSDVMEFLDKLVERKAAGSTINAHHCAIKFLFQDVLGKKITLKIRYSKKPKSLPTVLTRNEVIKLIDAITNPKHKLMIQLLYSAGLRVSELVNLKVKDIDFDANMGWVRNGKGRKDRLFILADVIKNKLPEHIKQNNLSYTDWLFYGRKKRNLHVRSVQEIIRKASKKAGIMKNVHPHTMRHSFATHLIELGYDVGTVQSLLGHNSTETTMRYLHMASPKMLNVKSPLDCS